MQVLCGFDAKNNSFAEVGAATNNTSKHRVLVVDDEMSIRESTSMLLKSAGYDVHTAEHRLLHLASVLRTPRVAAV